MFCCKHREFCSLQICFFTAFSSIAMSLKCRNFPSFLSFSDNAVNLFDFIPMMKFLLCFLINSIFFKLQNHASNNTYLNLVVLPMLATIISLNNSFFVFLLFLFILPVLASAYSIGFSIILWETGIVALSLEYSPSLTFAKFLFFTIF